LFQIKLDIGSPQLDGQQLKLVEEKEFIDSIFQRLYSNSILAKGIVAFNQLKMKNLTQIYTKIATNKSLVENFLDLNHKTLLELNTEDITTITLLGD